MPRWLREAFEVNIRYGRTKKILLADLWGSAMTSRGHRRVSVVAE
jgi:hypothetical protein